MFAPNAQKPSQSKTMLAKTFYMKVGECLTYVEKEGGKLCTWFEGGRGRSDHII